MVVTCQIEFENNPHGTYFAGQILNGKVTLTADRPKQVKGISLRIAGYATTHWTETTQTTTTDVHGKTTTMPVTISYNGREDYIASLTYLLGSEGSNQLTIAPGIHTYNFTCHIPTICPSSFEGIHGHIRYLIKVALIRPWKFDQTYTKGFTVLKIMDLNYDSPLLRVPSSAVVSKTFCCWPCRSEPLQIEVSVAQTGFVPGQNIPITVTVTNDSRVPVEEMKAYLVMAACYYSQTPSVTCRNTRLTISKLKCLGVPRNCKKQFYYELPVPATPPTCLNLCRILQVSYEVILEAKIKGMHTNQLIGTPITIGNVPLMGVIQQQPVNMQRNFLDNAAATTSTNTNEIVNNENVEINVETKNGMMSMNTMNERDSTVPWSADANIPPPSYEEATHVPHACINEDEKHDYGETDFAPRYPVFHMTTPTAPNIGGDEVDGSKTNNGTWL